MKMICKSDGFLQTGQSLFGAEIHQRQSLQLVHQVGRDMHRLSIKSVLRKKCMHDKFFPEHFKNVFNLLNPRDPGTGALPQHLAGNSV